MNTASLPKLDNIVLDEWVAQGGMAIVYRGHSDSGREVAIKLPLRAYSQQTAAAGQFQRERQSLRRINHPTVVKYVEYGEASRTPFIAMDWVQGAPLAALITEVWPLEPNRIRRLMLQLMEAVESCHAHRVIHADIKPENVIVAQDDSGHERAVLLDFGIACVDGQWLGDAGTVFGTPGYIAAEVLAGAVPTAASDIYALGVTFMEMLTGRRHLHDSTTTFGSAREEQATLEMRAANSSPDRWTNHPIENWAARAVEERVGHRFGSVTEMKDAFLQASMPLDQTHRRLRQLLCM